MVNTWILGSSYIEGSKLVATWTWVMEVLFLASGEILTALDQDVFDGKTAREVKQISRFRQRLFAEDGFREIQDDVRFLDRLPCKCSCLCWSSCCQMLKRTSMISACRRNDSASVEQFLQGPRNPNIGGNGPKLSKTIYTPNVRWAYHTRGFSVLACEAQNARVKWPTFEVKM